MISLDHTNLLDHLNLSSSFFNETMTLRLKLSTLSSKIVLLLLLLSSSILCSEAQLTAEAIMQKEMAWAKKTMEKHHRSRGYLPLRSPLQRNELYPRPDIDESLLEDDSSSSSSADVALDSITIDRINSSQSLRGSIAQ